MQLLNPLIFGVNQIPIAFYLSKFHECSLSEGGTPAKFLIIDDGWQDTSNEFQKEGEAFIEGSQ